MSLRVLNLEANRIWVHEKIYFTKGWESLDILVRLLTSLEKNADSLSSLSLLIKTQDKLQL